jgi:hypothetical protein
MSHQQQQQQQQQALLHGAPTCHNSPVARCTYLSQQSCNSSLRLTCGTYWTQHVAATMISLELRAKLTTLKVTLGKAACRQQQPCECH